jgi:hypothetical protein
MLRRHAPILRTTGAATSCFLVLAALRYDELSLSLEPITILWFLAGALYTNLFEYAVHRFPMHRGLPLLRHVRKHHIEHHRIFHGSNFRTANAGDLGQIPGRPWIFPLLLGAHYLLLTLILPIEATMVFLSACLLHYLVFEGSHWLTHLDGNAVDRALSQIPSLARLRERQIEHHRSHHERPSEAFNFNPPYLGDVLAATRKQPARSAVTVASRPARLRPQARPAVLYRTAIVLCAIALGMAALQHARSGAGASASRVRS